MTATSQEIIQSSQWHHLSIQEVTRHLDTNLETGLTSAVAAKKTRTFWCERTQKQTWNKSITKISLAI